MLIRAVFLIFGIFALSSAQKNALCTFPTYLRGKWVMMPEDKSMDDTGHYVIVRKDTIQIDLIDNVNNTLVTKSSEMYCKEVDGYNLLLQFINLNARFPGATHDSYILSQSGLPETVLGLSGGGWLLGDSGYPLKEWLMTPFISPSNQQEERYNNAHCRTRTVIERAFGVLKSRFRSPDETNKYLCLQFMQIMDTHYQYDLRRTNYADIGQEYFDPSVATNASLADTCILTQNRPIPLRRKSPGCNFPDMIHGNWAYSGSEYEDLTFTKDYLTVNVTGGEPVEFKCERMDHPPSQKQHYVALRSTGIKKVNGLDKDGVLCLRINMLPEGKISLQRLNSGTDANKTIKIISRAEPIYLHETCDLIDTNPEAFSITKV